MRLTRGMSQGWRGNEPGMKRDLATDETRIDTDKEINAGDLRDPGHIVGR
jgi:hypothetical protein